MIKRERLAAVLTHFISGSNPIVTGATALCLIGAVLLAGAGLADAARGLSDQIASSEIITQLTGTFPQEGASMEPKRAASFLRYLNAMAPVILNLEILPDEQIKSFNIIYDAAQECEIALRKFAFDEGSGRMNVICSAGNLSLAQAFYNVVKASAQFSNVDFIQDEEGENFTISFAF